MSDRDPVLSAETAQSPAAGLADLLDAYRSPDHHYNELRDPSGALRSEWTAFVANASPLGAEDFSLEQKQLARQLHDNGVTYNVHGGDRATRPWSLDVLPHIVSAAEWAALTAGLRQRARLLERVAADLYGPQRLLADGHLPAPIVLQHPGYLRPMHGAAPVSGRFLHVLAFDVARAPDGSWRVLDARTQAPSGAGYALLNRLSLSQLYADAFREQRVCLLAPYFRTLREALLEASPCPTGTPHIVLLTPGPYTETYVEHAYLARYLGFTLAEGGDLTVRDDRVYLKTVAGLKPVHGILRRLDDTFCDPLELRSDSSIGVPGLAQACRAGHVCVANALGAGVLESPALGPYLPGICQTLLDESLTLASVHAMWPPAHADIDLSDEAFDRWVIKPSFPGPRAQTVIGPALGQAERRAWAARITQDPSQFVLEEFLPMSHVPIWGRGAFESRAVMLRVFLAADGHGDYAVLSGGLARIGGSERDLVSGLHGGGSKDTWVLSDQPVERVTLLTGRLRPEDIVHSERLVSSRAAEHLFWMGRYAERSENSARLLRAVLRRLHDGSVSVSEGTVVRTCTAHGLLGPASSDDARVEWSPHAFEQTLIRGLIDPGTLQSVAYNVDQTVRAAGAVRDRLSSDNWRELNRLGEMLAWTTRIGGVSSALDMLDRVIMSLVAVGGLEMAHMTRDDGWRFMSLGRHLERLAYVTDTVSEVASSDRTEDPTLLDWLLDLSDSGITYRSRYMGRAEWLAVADLLLFDPRNPRSAVFQLAKMHKHVQLLPDGGLPDLVPTLQRLSLRRTGDATTGELFEDGDSLLTFIDAAGHVARQVSDGLTLRYFSHASESSQTLL